MYFLFSSYLLANESIISRCFPDPDVQLNDPSVDWTTVWKRWQSWVFSKISRNILFFFLHDKTMTMFSLIRYICLLTRRFSVVRGALRHRSTGTLGASLWGRCGDGSGLGWTRWTRATPPSRTRTFFTWGSLGACETKHPMALRVGPGHKYTCWEIIKFTGSNHCSYI